MIKSIFKWFTNTHVWLFIARHYIAHFTFRTFGYPKFPMSRYLEIKKILEEDNGKSLFAFVSADKSSLAWKLTNLMTKAKWGHAGFVLLDENKEPIIWHMKGSGITKWHLLDIVREVDDFAVIKMSIPEAAIDEAKARLNKIISAPTVKYDYQLELNPAFINWLLSGSESLPEGEKNLKLYCSEFVYVVGYGLVDDPDFKERSSYGLKSFEPDNVFACGEVVFQHRS